MDASDLKETARICSTICTRMTWPPCLATCWTMQWSCKHIPDSFIDLMVQKKREHSFCCNCPCKFMQKYAGFWPNGFPVSHKSGKGRHGFGIKSIRKVVCASTFKEAWEPEGILSGHGAGTAAVRRVLRFKGRQLDIMPGDFYGLCGLNGSGQSISPSLVVLNLIPLIAFIANVVGSYIPRIG